MRTCAICGVSIIRADLCNEHYREYGGCRKNYPEWLLALVRIQEQFERGSGSMDVSFSDVGRDWNGQRLAPPAERHSGYLRLHKR